VHSCVLFARSPKAKQIAETPHLQEILQERPKGGYTTSNKEFHQKPV
jgi:hypothetical protein